MRKQDNKREIKEDISIAVAILTFIATLIGLFL